MSTRVFTSESVTEGHPDKLCDQVADAVLDAHLAQDPMSRVACEVVAATGMVLMMGEITSTANVRAQLIARDVVREIGYTADAGFDPDGIAVLAHWNTQSPDIAQGVNAALESRGTGYADIGAGDQGMMFGFACDETPELMPTPIALAHRLTRRMAQVRKEGLLPWMRPDGKSQVTVRYENGRPVHIEGVVMSTQHNPQVDHDTIARELKKLVAEEVLPAELIDDDTKYWINPTGRFVIGGPVGDSGLTGRKIIVDTYGGYAGHGGGSFSGKDPTKVDRSASYMTRYIAKNIVAAGLAKHCHIEVAYAIGVAQPVSLLVETENSHSEHDKALGELILKHFDLRPAAIIERLDLRRPIFRNTAAYGHFGRDDQDFPWERTDMAKELAK